MDFLHDTISSCVLFALFDVVFDEADFVGLAAKSGRATRQGQNLKPRNVLLLLYTAITPCRKLWNTLEYYVLES